MIGTPAYVEALFIDNKGFTKTFAVTFPPPYAMYIPVIPRITASRMGSIDTAVLMPEIIKIEFNRAEIVRDPDTDKIKQIVYRERR